MNLHIGDIIAGKYVVEGFLGQGGMGFVVAARHKDFDELRAIKILSPSSLDSREARERFFREAKAMARLKSPHAVRVHESGRNIDGSPFIVMEYLEGKDLRAVAKERGILPPDEATLYVLQACDALIEAHNKGIVHRDIKLANLFLTTGAHGEPCVKVLDFGIAKLESSFQAEQANDLTQAAQMIGTPNYMSPEQAISGKLVDHRTDIWAMGVVLYKLVTGVLPFSAPSGEILRELVLSQTPIVPPSHFNRFVTPAFDAMLLAALERELNRRYPTMDAFAAALEPFAPRWYRPPSRRCPMPSVSDISDATKTQLLPERPRTISYTGGPFQSPAPWTAPAPASAPTLPSALAAANSANTVLYPEPSPMNADRSGMPTARNTLPMPAPNHVHAPRHPSVSMHVDALAREASRTSLGWAGQSSNRDNHSPKNPWRFIAIAVGGVCLALSAFVLWIVLRTTTEENASKAPATPVQQSSAVPEKSVAVPVNVNLLPEKEKPISEPLANTGTTVSSPKVAPNPARTDRTPPWDSPERAPSAPEPPHTQHAGKPNVDPAPIPAAPDGSDPFGAERTSANKK